MPDSRDRQVAAESLEIIRTKTEDATQAAARRGMSSTSLIRAVKRREVDGVMWGSRNEVRVWLDT